MRCNTIHLDQSVKWSWRNYCVAVTFCTIVLLLVFLSHDLIVFSYNLRYRNARTHEAYQKRLGEMKCEFHTWLRATADRWRTNWGEEGIVEWQPLRGELIFSWCLGSRSLECSQQALHALLDTGAHPASDGVRRRARQTGDTAGRPGIQTLLIPQLEPDTHREIKWQILQSSIHAV